MSELIAKLQKAIFDINKITYNDNTHPGTALNQISRICAQLEKAGDLSPRVTADGEADGH